MRYLRPQLFWLAFLLGAAACAPTAAKPSAATNPPTATMATQLTRPAPGLPNADIIPTPVPADSELELPVTSSVVQAAINDLAGQLAIGAEDITVVRAEPVTWSDGSLGCPQPGMMYTQALVDGAFIQLQVGDDLYDYHSGGSQDPFLCDSVAPIAPGELPPGATSSGSS